MSPLCSKMDQLPSLNNTYVALSSSPQPYLTFSASVLFWSVLLLLQCEWTTHLTLSCIDLHVLPYRLYGGDHESTWSPFLLTPQSPSVMCPGFLLFPALQWEGWWPAPILGSTWITQYIWFTPRYPQQPPAFSCDFIGILCKYLYSPLVTTSSLPTNSHCYPSLTCRYCSPLITMSPQFTLDTL